MKTLFIVLQILTSLVLIGVILLQSGKSAGLSGAIAGGAENLFGKNKARGMEALLDKLTIVGAVVFFFTSIGLFIMTKG